MSISFSIYSQRTFLVVTDSVDGLKWELNAALDCEMLG
jgi:hypothetical protein